MGDEGRSFAEEVLFGSWPPDHIAELERKAGIPVKVVK
jgi:hypothetical protein